MTKGRIILIICVAVAVILYLLIRKQMVARSPVDTDNAWNFGALVKDLIRAYENPSDQDEKTIEADLAKIRSVREDDAPVAQALVDTWWEVYLHPDDRLFVYGKDDPTALAECGVVNSATQAIVILGYELAGGEMQPELVGRCDAAAELARAFPEAILVCSGGATGKNNPGKHTEAGLMKRYLTEHCGIDASRICTDEEAMTTVDNVRKTFGILEQQGVRTMTIVTSRSHQQRAQGLYRVMARFYAHERGYAVQSVEISAMSRPTRRTLRRIIASRSRGWWNSSISRRIWFPSRRPPPRRPARRSERRGGPGTGHCHHRQSSLCPEKQ